MAVKSLIKYEIERDPVFAKWVTGVIGGERIRNCIQCGLCSASCPLSPYMDFTPRRLIHMAREGFKKDVLAARSAPPPSAGRSDRGHAWS